MEDLEATLENGHTRRDEIKDESGLLHTRAANRCGSYIESQHYNPTASLKGGIILTTDKCAICYDVEDIVSASEIRKERDVGGKNPLLVCRHCFDKIAEVPSSGGHAIMKQKKDQSECTKNKTN